MAILTPRQIATVAAGAGWQGKELQVAVAVALAESSGNTDVVNYLGCVGLWQVYGSVHRPAHPTWTDEWLKVPENNAKAAKTLYDASGGWGPWSAHTNGAYKQYMDEAAAGVANRSSGSPAVSGGGTDTSTLLDANGNPVRVTGIGATTDITKITFRNTPTMADFRLMGSKLDGNARKAVIAASVSFTTEQVSQVTVDILDPDLDFLDSGLADNGTPASLQGVKLVVATTSLGEQSNTPVVTLKCRPEVVQKLKRRRGTLVMNNVSPSQFVKAECEAVGAGCFIQGSPSRVNVSRDLPEVGQQYEPGEVPSSWTTFQRLAQELGFICFEENGTIYFAQPTYITEKGKKLPLEVGFRTGPRSKRALAIPQTSKSLDSKEATVVVQLPLSRASEARCGRALKLSGVPSFNGVYMVKSVEFNLAGSTQFVTVEAGTPIDPVAQPPEDQSAIDGSIMSGTSSSDGSWPLPSKYKVTTPFGVKGSWAAGYHTGADFACPNGTPVFAVYDGQIVGIGGWGDAYGNHIRLTPSNINGSESSWQYAYCHLSRIVVSEGQYVKAGQTIGYTGETGRTFGPHLHFELRQKPFRYGDDDLNPIPGLMRKGTSSSGPASGKKGTKTAADFVYWAQTRAGGRYVMGATRTYSPNQNVFDCSSLVYWALGQVGITGFPTTTFTQIPYLQRKGKQISVSEAYRIRGALLYREGGGRDHVAISLGNGKTIEASSPSVGVANLSAHGRDWTSAYLAPGLRY